MQANGLVQAVSGAKRISDGEFNFAVVLNIDTACQVSDFGVLATHLQAPALSSNEHGERCAACQKEIGLEAH